MQLKRYTDYALRTLTYLGLSPDNMVAITDIAERFSVSRNHLVKVVHRLGTAGFITTIRGKGGGLKLAHEPEDIGIGNVVRIMEEDFDIVNCEDPICPILPACTLKEVLNEATEGFLEVLDDYTLADLLNNRKKLRRRLKVHIPITSIN